MKCDCYFCVYYDANECLLGDVPINEYGRCKFCNFLKIKDDVLKIKAQNYLKLKEKKEKEN